MTFVLNPYRYGVAGPFSPSSITGLKVWLQADGTLWQDSARTTPATADTHPVGAIDDLSGNGFHATQSTSTLRPLLKTNIINGKPVLRFDGLDDVLATASWTALAQPNTMFSVHKFLVTTNNRIPNDGTVGNRHVLGYIGGGAATFRYFAGNLEDDSLVAADTAVHLHTAVFNGTGSFYRIDRVQKVAGSPGTNALGGLRLGSSASAGAHANFDFAEILVYDSQLTGTQIDNVETYLRDRWGTP